MRGFFFYAIKRQQKKTLPRKEERFQTVLRENLLLHGDALHKAILLHHVDARAMEVSLQDFSHLGTGFELCSTEEATLHVEHLEFTTLELHSGIEVDGIRGTAAAMVNGTIRRARSRCRSA